MRSSWELWALVMVGLCAAPARGAEHDWRRFSELEIWEDGLSEMSFYQARDTIYGTPREYTRVHLLNRQWMGGESGVKAPKGAPDAVSVFKFNVAEEIPTENYNYRYLTTLFLQRPDLKPFKMVVSSQEWCGTTFKHLRWSDEGLRIQSFSYFGEEGDDRWTRPAEVMPFEAVFLLCRACAASGEERELVLLPPMRSNHAVEPAPKTAAMKTEGGKRTFEVPAGSFEAVRVTVDGPGVQAWFEVEGEAPFRLLAFQAGGVEGRLVHVERRAYWEKSSKSEFYKPGQAP